MKFFNYCQENKVEAGELANILDVEVEQIKDYQEGREALTLTQIKKLCLYFNISADEYFI